MAGHDLIDTYLDALRRHLGEVTGADDLVAEAEDHLRCTADASCGAGAERHQAQVDALERFGRPELVAPLLARPRGGPAVPTASTRSAGTTALVAAAAWPTVVALWWAGGVLDANGHDWEGIPRILWMVGSTVLLLAAALTTAVAGGLSARHGRFGPIGIAGIVALGLGTVAGVLGWFVAGWGGLIALGAILVGSELLRRGLAPRSASLAFATSWALGIGVWLTLDAIGVGDPDEWGDHPVALTTGLAVGAGLMATGLAGLGTWLRSEEPLTQPHGAHVLEA